LLLQGYVYGVVSALLSAVAAVYTEWVLKKNNDTLYWQNMLLYGFGACFNFANLVHRYAGGRWFGGLLVGLSCRLAANTWHACSQPDCRF
jgi:UDP-sugar transporter A1/2/3